MRSSLILFALLTACVNTAGGPGHDPASDTGDDATAEQPTVLNIADGHGWFHSSQTEDNANAYQALCWRGVRDNGEGQNGDWEQCWLTAMPVLDSSGMWTEYFGSEFDPGQYRVAAASPTASNITGDGYVDHSRGADELEELEFVFTFLECDVWKSNLVFAFTDAGEVYRPDAYGLGSFLSGSECPDVEAASYTPDQIERIEFLLDAQDIVDEMARERRIELGVE